MRNQQSEIFVSGKSVVISAVEDKLHIRADGKEYYFTLTDGTLKEDGLAKRPSGTVESIHGPREEPVPGEAAEKEKNTGFQAPPV